MASSSSQPVPLEGIKEARPTALLLLPLPSSGLSESGQLSSRHAKLPAARLQAQPGGSCSLRRRLDTRSAAEKEIEARTRQEEEGTLARSRRVARSGWEREELLLGSLLPSAAATRAIKPREGPEREALPSIPKGAGNGPMLNIGRGACLSVRAQRHPRHATPGSSKLAMGLSPGAPGVACVTPDL